MGRKLCAGTGEGNEEVGTTPGWIQGVEEWKRDRGKGGCEESKWRRDWLGGASIIVINTITINAAETSVRSSSELGFLLLHFYRDQAFPAT